MKHIFLFSSFFPGSGIVICCVFFVSLYDCYFLFILQQNIIYTAANLLLSEKKPKKKERRSQRRRAGNLSTVAMATPKITVNRSSRQKRAGLVFDPHDLHHIRHHGNQCSHRRLDDCAWPQCNASCPRLRNPFTGEDMDYVDLLMQFGLDLSAVSGAIGVDLTTLENMDHGQLLHILIQSSR